MKATILAAVAAFAAAVPALAQNYDRAALLPIVERACQNSLLGDPNGSKALTMSGVSLQQVCSCQAQLFVGGTSMEILEQARLTGQFDSKRFRLAATICMQQQMLRLHQ